MNRALTASHGAPFGGAVSIGAFFAIIAVVASILGLIEPTHGQVQNIPLRSGIGSADGLDSNVRVLLDGSPGNTEARTAPRAVVRDFALDAGNLLIDPIARWIGPGETRKAEGQAALYSIPFTVNAGPVGSADLEWIGGSGALEPDRVAAELLVNGQSIGQVPVGAVDASTERLVFDGFAQFLMTGTNWLQIEVPGAKPDGGLIFSARIRIWDSADPTDPAASEFADASRSDSDEAILETPSGGCGGFTCRPRGDLDSDHDVDLIDYARFLDCVSGAKSASADDCEYADFDCDGLIDLADVGYFQAAFGGS